MVGYLPVSEKEENENQSNEQKPLSEARGEGSPWVRIELGLRRALRAEKVLDRLDTVLNVNEEIALRKWKGKGTNDTKLCCILQDMKNF